MARAVDRVVSPANGEVLESVDPATQEVVDTVPVTPPERVAAVAEEVARVQRGWALVPLQERLRVLARAADDVLDRSDELAAAITRETGKTVVESHLTEVGPTAGKLSWAARFGHRYLGPERIPDPDPWMRHKRHWFVYRPLGVVGVIGPWNYPFSLTAVPTAFALAAGNGVVLKPSELSPLSGDLLAGVFARAGLPDGLLRVVHGRGEVGAALCGAPAVRKIFFTGSVATGRKVLEEAGRHGKTVHLELGGKDAAIVFRDADLDRAVAGIVFGALANCGHTCAGVERIYVDRRISDEFLRRLRSAVGEILPGPPSDPSTQIGPTANEMQYRRIVEHLEDAVAKGAAVEQGGEVALPGLRGRFFRPIVLTGVDHSMRVMSEETFGPILPVMPFDSEEEAVGLANDTPFGLGASLWSRDVARARRIADRIEAGMVWINDVAYSHGFGQLPWGGIKGSGTGPVASKFGFYEMVDKQLVGEDGGRVPVLWWHPYSAAQARGMLAGIGSSAYSTLRRRFGALWAGRRDLVGLIRSRLR
jgi:acyl-CoA reductase-like NAD-dependent aldehyde dehydrogenase